MLIDYLFTHTTAHRIEATTSLEAAPKRLEAKPAGMSREGTIRQAEWREGDWRDIALYAILRPEWEANRHLD
ncbi:hypothetical protein ASE14_09645 [Agromyces sp. Root81]|nr:hypothetical protein ASE14_09645 [Agromyces sp. Root81]